MATDRDVQMPFRSHLACSARCEGTRHWAVVYGPPNKTREETLFAMNDALELAGWPGQVIDAMPSPEGPPPAFWNARMKKKGFYSYEAGAVFRDTEPIADSQQPYLICWDGAA